MSWDMLLSDIPYGRFYIFELTTDHNDQSGNKRREPQNIPTIKINAYICMKVNNFKLGTWQFEDYEELE